MIQESRLLIEMADTVQEKIVQCQKAGNLPLPPLTSILFKKNNYNSWQIFKVSVFILKIQIFSALVYALS